jgi:hypothetical protein
MRKPTTQPDAMHHTPGKETPPLKTADDHRRAGLSMKVATTPMITPMLASSLA